MDFSQMRKTAYIGLAILFLASANAYAAADPPHGGPGVSPPFDCGSCHDLHGGGGDNLTIIGGNANLCLSCHVTGGQANDIPLLSSEQAVPGVSGVHHRWDAVPIVPAVPLEAMFRRLELGTTAVCSTCHNPHSQTAKPFDPAAPPVPGDRDRHFQRVDNDTNQMCRNCHEERDINSVRTYAEGALLSHPVGVSLPSGDPKFHDAPKEPNGSPQTGGPSFSGNGAGDTNSTNNLILDASGQVQCMTCHNVHFTDSDPNTEDKP